MLSVEQALKLIADNAQRLDPQQVPLTDALDCVLAEDVVSPVDSPPFDKALMDGYAVRSDDCSAPGASLEVIEEVVAGQCPTKSLQLGQATRIMTGAPVPQGSDAVVPVEKTDSPEPLRVDVKTTVAAEGEPAQEGRGDARRRGCPGGRQDH